MLFVLLFAALLPAGENLIVNPRLIRGQNGKVTGWIIARGTVTAKEGFTEIAPSDPGKGFVVFQRLKANRTPIICWNMITGPPTGPAEKSTAKKNARTVPDM